MKKVICFIIVLVISFDISAQKKILVATRIFVAPKIDGILDESSWQNLPCAKDFITNDPIFGNPAEEKSEVKLIYDDYAIYVSAYFYDSEPDKIRSLLSPRDNNLLADEFAIGLDTYHDGIHAYRFQVTAANVQTDRLMSPDISPADRSWNPVWQSAVKINDDGWVVEVKIPFSALRFPEDSIQTWGIQFGRLVARTNEFTTWNPVDNNIKGAVHQWGLLTNLEKLSPPLRLSVSPYVSFGIKRQPLINVEKKYSFTIFYSGGADLKYGINSGFTIDMTLIPDFSQVKSDNTILNLTPFEVQYEEQRQFFTEGVDLFQKAGVFYSRRIGAIPSGFFSISNQLGQNESIHHNPPITKIVNAAKLSGRTAKGLGIGILNAITDNMYAEVHNDSSLGHRKILTEPLTNYSVLVMDQSLKNNSGISFTNTSVIRRSASVNANVSAIDVSLLDRKKVFNVKFRLDYSRRKLKHLPVSEGIHAKISIAKVSGVLRAGYDTYITSPNYNPNDLGFHSITDIWNNDIYMGLNVLKPKAFFINWFTTLNFNLANRYHDFAYEQRSVFLTGNILFKNYYRLIYNFNTQVTPSHDYYEPRTVDRYFIQPIRTVWKFELNTDIRKKNQFLLGSNFRISSFPEKAFNYEIYISPAIHISQKASIKLFLDHTLSKHEVGFANFDSSRNIIFGDREFRKTETTLTLNYIFSPFLNISLKGREYWSGITYESYSVLNRDGTLTLTDYSGNENINFNSFTLDVILSWQFSTGSYFTFVYKNNILQADHLPMQTYFDNLSKIFSIPAANEVSLKVIYYLDYLRARSFFSSKK